MDTPAGLRVHRLPLLRNQQGFGLRRNISARQLLSLCSLILTTYLMKICAVLWQIFKSFALRNHEDDLNICYMISQDPDSAIMLCDNSINLLLAFLGEPMTGNNHSSLIRSKPRLVNTEAFTDGLLGLLSSHATI